MKNIIISSFSILALGLGLNAQTISFETSEGYTLGNINGQSNWETTSDDLGGNIENQVITDEAASDGDYSFKIIKEPEFSSNRNLWLEGFIITLHPFQIRSPYFPLISI